MNQNEQMLREALREAMEWNWLDGDVPEEIVQKCEQALAAEPAPTVKKTTQNWAGMDGATAWQLIDRHAESWEETAKMMHEWLEANTPESAQPTELEMHRADYQDCKSAGFESPGELLSAYKTLLARTTEPAPLVRLTEQEAKKAYEKGELDAIEKGIESASHGLGLREVIDEMIAKNGGK